MLILFKILLPNVACNCIFQMSPRGHCIPAHDAPVDDVQSVQVSERAGDFRRVEPRSGL